MKISTSTLRVTAINYFKKATAIIFLIACMMLPLQFISAQATVNIYAYNSLGPYNSSPYERCISGGCLNLYASVSGTGLVGSRSTYTYTWQGDRIHYSMTGDSTYSECYAVWDNHVACTVTDTAGHTATTSFYTQVHTDNYPYINNLTLYDTVALGSTMSFTFAFTDMSFQFVSLGVYYPQGGAVSNVTIDTIASTATITVPNFSSSDAGQYSIYISNDLCGNSPSYALLNVSLPPCNISLTDSITSVVCTGSSNGQVKLTASGGTVPYKYKNGIHGSWQYSNIFAGLTARTDTFYVLDTLGCGNSIIATIPTITSATPSVTVTAAHTSLCSSAIDTFTATPVNGGSTPSYQWYKNGTAVGINSPTYIASSFVNGDSVWVIVTSSMSCANPTTASSLKVHLTVTTSVTPTVTASASLFNLSSGSVVDTFRASPANGGSTPSYQWYKNGTAVGTNSSTYVASGFSNNDSIWVVMTSNAVCASPAMATSSHIHLTVSSGGSTFTLYMDTVIGNNGQTATIHVRVRHFTKIVSAQGTIQFNPAVVTYASVQQFGVSSLTSGDFGTTNVGTGILIFSWSDPTLLGQTLPDSSVFFSITFNIIGTGGQSSAVSLVNSPTVLEFADTSLNAIPYNVYPGLVNVSNNVVISGRVHAWAENAGVQKATVSLAGSSLQTSVLTDTTGTYTFTVPAGSADTITPSKNNDSIRTNGVTTLDVLTVQRYILGTYTITGPYKLIAADVNSSGTITTLDYTLIQALILGNITSFPGNKLWNFVPTSYTFSNSQAPWGFPYSRYYASATAQTGQDFIGIKLGDVTGAWNPLLRDLRTTVDTVSLYVPHITVPRNGLNVSVPVKGKDFRSISGFQFTMTWDSTQLSFAGVDTTSRLQINYGASMASSGILGIQWNDPNGTATTIPDDSTLFSVQFNVLGGVGDSSSFDFDSSLTAVQFIDTNLNVMDYNLMSGRVYITYATGIQNETTDAVSIYPNPANSEVIIDLTNPRAGKTEVKVSNISGELVYNKDISGQSTCAVSLSNWAEGIYMVRITYADRVRNLKLVVVHP